MDDTERNQPIDDEIGGNLDAIDAGLLEGLAQDARLESGIPADQRSDELGFIQMTGLTRPELAGSEDENSAPQNPGPDREPAHPVNFFEPGVVDVDAAADPGAVFSPIADSEELSPGFAAPQSVTSLRELLAQLGTGDAGEAEPPGRELEDPHAP
jgi:hypothetical protein